MGHPSDDFDAYDLSEFSVADFVHIDSSTREHAGHGPTDATGGSVEEAWRRVGTRGSGGPQIAVALEHASDEFVLVKVAGGGSGTQDDNPDVVSAKQNVDELHRGKSSRGGLCHSSNATDSRSPYEVFRSHGTLSVSDLVRPAWCEVQFDYGLRQGRSLVLADRPDSFVSGEGKVIMVDKKVAEVNEEVLEHGRSIHKELENELHPEQIVIAAETKEEYWAIRLFDMLGRLDALMELHCCREMPVFGIVQDQPIIGIIDEILLKTIPGPKAESNLRSECAPTSAPETPKQSKRRKVSPPQSHVTDFFPSPSKAKASRSPSPIPTVIHELSILDTKTRHVNSLPSDDDAFSSRMQLMLYRHLLSELISPTFSFSTFWENVRVDPFAKFSDEFLQQCGVAPLIDGKVVLGFPECLKDVADLWRSTVDSRCLRSVSPTLEIVYRTRSKRGAAVSLKPSRADTSGDFAAAEQEKWDIDRAIEASLREIGHDPDLERAIAESMRDVTQGEGSSAAVVDGKNTLASTWSPSPRGSEQLSDMPHIPWYAWSGDTESGTTQSAVVQGPRHTTAELRPSGLQVAPSQPEAPKVIGTKRFAFDEAAMYTYVRDVLQWWRGERPPRGVEVEQTRRCFTCEYRDECEWREKKATEAQEKYVELKSRRMEGTDSFDTT